MRSLVQTIAYNGPMTCSFKTYNLGQLQDFVSSAGEKPFRTQQLLEWVYAKRAASFDQMTNLSKAFRASLENAFSLDEPVVANKRVSKDGTRKYLLQLHDGNLVETVAIPSSKGKDRLTVCFSTQVGCAMACAFCATGHEGFTRNLGMGEMVDQILVAQEDMGMRVSNVVAMGQGEPFLNYQNTIDALHVLNHKQLVGIGARRITVSTCGVIPGIARFAEEPYQYTLAVSLHSALQEKRDVLMPKMQAYPLSQLRSALFDYLEKTDRRVTFEYLLIKGVNDGDEDLRALQQFCDGLLCHVNLLPVNAVEGSPYQPAAHKTVERWLAALEANHTEATLRTSRGSDIEGACGQLKNAVR
ncbi:MAG: 23S rRNA (adenine(2503)-C(2))-methyltransferase RlmN [Coriobacteriia bacterium]|nr:23S rRNA (adenine(2503)-C(2))-methyltransferase RlmN [Coriobacteriia bacterium]